MSLRTFCTHSIRFSKRSISGISLRLISQSHKSIIEKESSISCEPKDVLFDTSISYPQIMSRLRKQAQHSILLQLDVSERDNANLLLKEVKTFCSHVGDVQYIAPYYIKVKNGRLCSYLVEFKDLNSIHKLSLLSDDGKLRTRIAKLKPNELKLSHANDSSKPPTEKVLAHTHSEFVQSMMRASSISEQTNLFYTYCSATNKNLRAKFFLSSVVEDFFNYKIESNLTAVPFGSSMAGFSTPSSDLDVSITNIETVPSKLIKGRHVAKNIHHLSTTGAEQYKDILRSTAFGLFCDVVEDLHLSLPGVTRTTPIDASVPILTFNFSPLSINMDISLHNVYGIKMSWCLNAFSRYDSRVAPFLYLVKVWGKQVGITRHGDKDYKGLTPFMLVSLALFYLMRVNKPVIPTLHETTKIKTSEATLIAGFQANLIKHVSDLPPSQNTSSVEELFMSFLEYYTRFDFKHYGISLSSGIVTPVSSQVVILYPFSKDNVAKMCTLQAVEQFKNEAQRAVLKLESYKRNKRNNKPWGILSIVDVTKELSLLN
nr:poly(A) RNA polymerase, mitochondrial [Ciona intestinalis]|eukprot:XP_026691366.1 poly(A) RNA polymerase, mitochondrial [Ciona intestinalis]